jgi:hypothetical protein
MNADKLLKIAKLLDEKNLYSLADKVDRIAQNVQRDIYDFNNNPNAGETWYNRLGRIFSGNATIYDYPGLANTLRQNDKQMQFWKNRRQNRSLNRNQYQQVGQYPPQVQQNQQPQMIQQQNVPLASTTPQQFVQNLFAFGKQNNIKTLSQTIDMYAKQGGTFNGQPINQNPQVINLYNQIKNNPATLNPQQLVQMLSGANR